ncbi:MAG TPA: ComF family protein [Solirubrobacteraceae bacterium]|nr:ComF family protein [Solirubrobacteraceae bacterium]
MLADLLALVVPPRCAACRAPGRRADAALCGDCRRALPWLTRTSCCARCALPLPHAARRHCPARDAAFDAAWSAVAYEGVARDAMHALKFQAARPLAAVMAAQIATNAPPALLAPGAAVVAVPAHPGRLRRRGFDPAELLARALARRTGLPLVAALRRSGAPAARQLGASRELRRAPGRLGFVARGPAPPTVVLIDDVHTTGATLGDCAHALRDAGAQRISAVTWARTL